MAVSRRMIVFCFITLVVCSFLVKASNAGQNDHGCNHGGAQPGDSQRCEDTPEDEDDFDDTFKLVNNIKIKI
ncbi:hypothetical protein ERO13_D11G158933v2 [Gossypium hirsutum]|uniref:Uncharacterized protein n=3 Tax=Gossypium TaxID=3633 RepID=A0A5J5PE80_GOSBA|nr:hypothetical protein ES319_D11G166500v1 [Gossypium barbadense]KAG4120693.1 hypothetical protein ERO13_D11G158933v2 [Gossypium hirsutum]PPD72695.1 hypothetical protein GOBAR_DD30408 [Gossypium barbadense]TYG45468.1 hypothetical protein ES288_D11G176100v1 [Gossypium darwinii]TYH44140.1 hypothetical protein ES332_D11G172900v1 [Gossypium tomentosum]